MVAYCYRCQTPLSNFEARLDDSFRPRQDPSVTLRFKVRDTERPTYFLAWTTTPWTLPSNVALAVGGGIAYERLRLDGEDYYIAAARHEAYAKLLKGAERVETVPGEALAGMSYEPLFPYFQDTPNGFQVVVADFVSTEDGTGIVHIAPAFGEDDFKLGAAKQARWWRGRRRFRRMNMGPASARGGDGRHRRFRPCAGLVPGGFHAGGGQTTRSG
ncbi:class I tRNA ligase family protein [bacterium]|nr:class I tRNA ligase family protein [bacterium]